jgi:hypothetical protein
MMTGRFAVWIAAAVAVPTVLLGVTVGLPALRDVQAPAIQVPQVGPTISTSVAPTTPTLESQAPATQPNVSTSETNPPMPPSQGPVDTNIPDPNNPNTTEPNTERTEEAPAPSATAAPHATAAPSTTHSAPTGRRSPSSVAPQPQRPTQPPAKRCSDGSTVTGDESCPTPQSPTSQSPAPPPQCPHIAVPSGSTCGRTGTGG